MPHIVLQQSSNVSNTNSSLLFQNIHNLLVKMLPTKLDNCKSRLIIADDYYIADGHIDLAFAHLDIAILPDREPLLLKQISQQLCNMIAEHLILQNSKLNLKISVEIRTLSDYYSKN
jgi:5-carboxymethyl-2-hydroxymuconate isomerase